MVRTIQVTYGKMTKDGKKRNRDKAPIDGVPFKKQSIFYKYLPYWVDIEVRHAIDGMHLKKGSKLSFRITDSSQQVVDTFVIPNLRREGSEVSECGWRWDCTCLRIERDSSWRNGGICLLNINKIKKK
jgi:hypothetical protein